MPTVARATHETAIGPRTLALVGGSEPEAFEGAVGKLVEFAARGATEVIRTRLKANNNSRFAIFACDGLRCHAQPTECSAQGAREVATPVELREA